MISTPLLRLALIAASLAAFWAGTAALTRQFANLPVRTQSRPLATVAVPDAQTLYPVWVQQATSTPPTSDADLDAILGSAPTVAIDTPPEPDYRDLVRERARVDGVADNGAFISGHFYSIGDRIDVLSVSGPRGNATPVLTAVAPDRVTLSIDGQHLVITTERQR